ncbi:MAG: hypothetical protein ABIE43_05275 [Patescibacteria group bacterium]
MTKIKKELTSNGTIKIKKKFSLYFLNIKNINRVLILLIVACGIFYLTGINDLTVKGFKMQELKKKIRQISSENKDIEHKTMSLESLKYLDERAKNLRMVAVGDINYIEVGGELVAKK